MRVAVAVAVVLVVLATVVLVRGTDDQAVIDVGPPPTTRGVLPDWRPDGSLAPGWHGLPAGPLGPMYPRAMVWTGSELIVWRGEGGLAEKMARAASFDPRRDEWRELPPDPLDVPYLSGVGASGAWTGTEALFWAAEGMVAWSPATSSWRDPADPPHPHERDGVWTGSEVVFWADGLAYDPFADSWRVIARPSEFLIQSVNDDAEGLLWSGRQVVVVGGLSGAYDPVTDAWREFGAPLTQEAGSPGIAWDGFTATAVEIDGRVTAFDYSPDSAAVLDLENGVWMEVPELAPPLDPSGWLRTVANDDGRVLFVGGGADGAQLRGVDGSWTPVPAPSSGALIGTGEVVFSYSNVAMAPLFAMFIPPPSATAWEPASLGAGWHEFDRGPLPADRSPLAMAYDYRRSAVYLFGFRGSDEVTQNDGYALNLRTQEWSAIPAAPLDTLDGLDGMFDGESFVVWSQAGAAFWVPETGAWRKGASPPRSLERPIWLLDNPAQAGADLVYWADGLAYNMQRDEWREIARPPTVPTRTSAVFDGYELIVVGLSAEPTVTAQYAFDVAANTWRELPPSGLNGQAVDLLWRGYRVTEEILGVDYASNTKVYDPGLDRWRDLEPIPTDFGEDGPPRVVGGSEGVLVTSGSGFPVAVLGPDERWRPIEAPQISGRPLAVNGGFFLVGNRIALYVL
jgi:hypothetical protein